MLLASLGMSWVAVTIQGYRRQRDAARAIKEAGGHVIWRKKPPALAILLRDNSLRDVFAVNFVETEATDASLQHLEALTGLRNLVIRGQKVTDAGIAHLKGLHQLDCLILDCPNVTDAGLTFLQGFHQLTLLGLNHTKVSDEGVKILQRALPECEISRDRIPPVEH
jgi:hypothetical protein